ncbi:MAG TPA: hypothetical protein DCQ50_04245 [Chryseobacterium sp.]|nr:hypothetical protein [Chryseobacterium sp.]
MIVNSIILGRAKGSAGNVTVSTQKGRTILKQKASIVSNPRSPAQLLQRSMIMRAVFVWQLFGNMLKSGITSLVEYGSQYNTFVGINANHFKASTFTKETFRNADLANAYATVGRLGNLNAVPATISVDSISFNIDTAKFKSIAKAGDVVKVLLGHPQEQTMDFVEKTLSANDIANFNGLQLFQLDSDFTNTDPVCAVWLESGSGNDSTTSKFSQ